MKLSQPFFTLLVLIGGVLLSILGFYLVGENDDLHCAIQPYQFNIAFTFTFSPLLIKSWRVHTLFNINPMARKSLIPNHVLLMYTLGFVFIDVILLAITLYTPPNTGTMPVSSFLLSSNGAYASVTSCGFANNISLFYTEICYKGLLVIMACYLSYKTRNVQDAIAGSKILLVIVYNTAVISGIALVLLNSLTDIPSRMFCISLCLTIFVCLNAALMVGPWMMQLILVGDSEAANEAIGALGRGAMYVAPKPQSIGPPISQPSASSLKPTVSGKGNINLRLGRTSIKEESGRKSGREASSGSTRNQLSVTPNLRAVEVLEDVVVDNSCTFISRKNSGKIGGTILPPPTTSAVPPPTISAIKQKRKQYLVNHDFTSVSAINLLSAISSPVRDSTVALAADHPSTIAYPKLEGLTESNRRDDEGVKQEQLEKEEKEVKKKEGKEEEAPNNDRISQRVLVVL